MLRDCVKFKIFLNKKKILILNPLLSWCWYSKSIIWTWVILFSCRNFQGLVAYAIAGRGEIFRETRDRILIKILRTKFALRIIIVYWIKGKFITGFVLLKFYFFFFSYVQGRGKGSKGERNWWFVSESF